MFFETKPTGEINSDNGNIMLPLYQKPGQDFNLFLIVLKINMLNIN